MSRHPAASQRQAADGYRPSSRRQVKQPARRVGIDREHVSAGSRDRQRPGDLRQRTCQCDRAGGSCSRKINHIVPGAIPIGLRDRIAAQAKASGQTTAQGLGPGGCRAATASSPRVHISREYVARSSSRVETRSEPSSARSWAKRAAVPVEVTVGVDAAEPAGVWVDTRGPYHSGRFAAAQSSSAVKDRTSRIWAASRRSISKRSTPSATPPEGGMPSASAARKRSSSG